MLRPVKRLLRAPRLIVGEIATIALVSVLGAALPQAGVASTAELERFRAGGPLWTALVNTFALDHIFRSRGFATLTILASASLMVVVFEQLRRVRAQWSQRLTPASFRSAPFRAEFERPASARSGVSAERRKPRAKTAALCRDAATHAVQIWTEKRVGLLGSPLFHLGLLLVVAAGLWRALFGAEAGVDLLEGQTLAPTTSAWAIHWPGALARPFRLATPLTLKSVHATRYESGELRDLKVRVALGEAASAGKTEIAVNHDSQAAGGRVFLTADFGPAALLEWQPIHAAPIHEAVLLQNQGTGNFEAASSGPNGERAYLRALVDAAGAPPQTVEVRVMKGGALLAIADARPGESISLPGGTKLALRGTPFWARLRGSRDSALWLAYLGFALVMSGVTLIFTVVKLDCCIVVTPLGERERVFIALKPQRFAPLFDERFQQFLQEQGGRASPRARTLPPDGAREDARPPVEALGRLLRSRPAGWLFLLLCVPCLTSCQRSSVEQARTLVEHYNRIVSEAYRRGDVRLIDPVVGPKEGKKLTGLIGVRLDFGITLDSHLLSLEVTGVEQSKTAMRVRTKERWRYRDLRIGTGEQVGEASLDSYEMLYVFTNINKAWLVDEIHFANPPQVSRKQTPWVADRKTSATQPEQPHP